MRLKHLLSVFLTLLTLSVGQMWGASTTGYFKKTTASGQLAAGTKYGTLTDVSATSNVVTLSSANVEMFVLETGYNSSGFSFKGTSNISNNYLYWTSGNSLNKNGTKSANTSWTITWSSSTATIANNSTSTRLIRFNSDRFACYTSSTGTLAQVYKKAYKVTYNGNGSTGGSVPTDANYYYKNASVTAKSNSGTLVKNGYTFIGWNTKANGTGTAVAATGSATFTLTYNTTLYAQWEAEETSDPLLELTGSGAFGNVDVNATKDLNFTLAGSNLTANASVEVTGTGFSLVTPAGGSLSPTDGSITGSNNITVRFAPTAGGAHNGTLTVSSDGAENVSVSLSGTGQLSDTFIDELHSTSGYTSGSPHVEKGSYGTTPKITDKAVATSGTCAQQHYHFVGWITAAKYEAGTAIAAGDLQKPTSATGATYYAVWAKKGAEGSDNEELTNNELKTNVTNTQRAYDTAKTHSDGDIDYTFNVYTDAANRPWVQLKSADPSAIKIEAPGNISRVDMTITSATNSSGGVADITKHDAFSTAGTISLRSTSRTGTVVASNTGANVSDNVLSITVSSPANSTLYLTTSTGCRIWGITVYYSTVSYTDYRAVCCNELGSINGSFLRYHFWGPFGRVITDHRKP